MGSRQVAEIEGKKKVGVISFAPTGVAELPTAFPVFIPQISHTYPTFIPHGERNVGLFDDRDERKVERL